LEKKTRIGKGRVWTSAGCGRKREEEGKQRIRRR